MTHDFKVGDRVRAIGRAGFTTSGIEAVGLTGTVETAFPGSITVRLDEPYTEARHADDETALWFLPKNLELIEQEAAA